MSSRSELSFCAALFLFLGNAPATLKLPAGSHAILLKFPGHADWRRTLEALKSSKVSLEAALELNP